MIRVRVRVRSALKICTAVLGVLFVFGGVGPSALATNLADWLALPGYLPQPSTAFVQGILVTVGIVLILVLLVAHYTPRAARQILAEFNPDVAFEARVAIATELLAKSSILSAFRCHSEDWALWVPIRTVSSDARAAIGPLAIHGIVETELRDVVSHETIRVSRTAHPPIEHREAPRSGSITINSTFAASPQIYFDNEIVQNQRQVEYVRLTPLGRAVSARLRDSQSI